MARTRVGDVEILSLCDGIVSSSRPIEESFLGAEPGTWDRVRLEHPDTIGPDGRWVLHVFAFVLRSGGRTILVDAGFGPASAPAFSWTGRAGRLPVELAETGVEATEIDYVVITHVHDDHIGWIVFPGGDSLRFPNARHLIQRADWEWIQSGVDLEDEEISTQLLAPIKRHGALELVDGDLALTDELRLVHAPGHTPGHQVVLVDSAGERGILSADTANHPEQVSQPTLASGSDDDPELAARTRAEVVDRIDRDERLMVASHFATPFGRIVAEDGRRRFRPEP